MGQGWRRVSEAVLQKAPISLGNKTFRHTSNGRNELMFKEATEFAQSIRLLEKDLRAVLKCIDGQYKNLRGILVSPVPNIYEEGEHGPVSTQPGVRLLGANMDVEAIPQAAEAARQRITREVFEPLQEWLKAYNRAEDHMRRLEAVRLELDSRRRTVTNLEGRLTRIRADLGSTKHKGLIEMKEVEETLARKEEKMSMAEEAFRTQELLVYHSLVIIVKDTAVLRDYTYSSLLIIQECFGAAAAAYDAKPAPQGSTNYAQLAYHPPAPVPGNKYEAQFTGAERSTPKGLIGSMFERIRKGKVPDSPVGSHPRSDANDTHDQVPYAPHAYVALGPRQQQQQHSAQPYYNYLPSGRPTQADILDQPGTGHQGQYMQPPPSAPQQALPAPAGGYYANQPVVYAGYQQQQQAPSPGPASVQQGHPGYHMPQQHAHQQPQQYHAMPPQQQHMIGASGTGWNAEGY